MLTPGSTKTNAALPASQGKYFLREGRWMFPALLFFIWVSIPCIRSADWGMGDGKSHKPAGTAPLSLSHTPLKAVQPETRLVLLRNGACFQENGIKLFTSSLGYIPAEAEFCMGTLQINKAFFPFCSFFVPLGCYKKREGALCKIQQRSYLY